MQSYKQKHELQDLKLDATILDVWATTPISSSETSFHWKHCKLPDLLQKTPAVKKRWLEIHQAFVNNPQLLQDESGSDSVGTQD